MPVDLQLDPDLALDASIDIGMLESGLAVAAAVTTDTRLQQAVCVRICGAAESQALNSEYRQQNKPTNVLSFPADIDTDLSKRSALSRREIPLGDLAICWPVIEQEARSQGKRVEAHFTHLYIHGLLHLLGFDHETQAQAGAMEALEVQILAQLGLPDPYESGN
jgi:probable rRNA maturation factor